MLESANPRWRKAVPIAVAARERASVRSTFRLLGGCRASAWRRPLSRLFWNDVNVEVRGECYELFYERFAAEEGLTDAAALARAPHDDLRNTRQACELGDLKRDVVAIDGFHMCSELLG